jgi:hypothetical protein
MILNYTSWRKRCFVSSQWEHGLLTKRSVGRDDEKHWETRTQNTIICVQSCLSAAEIERLAATKQ